jgi:hypothetical protein
MLRLDDVLENPGHADTRVPVIDAWPPSIRMETFTLQQNKIHEINIFRSSEK